MNYLFTHQNYVFDVNDRRNFQNIYHSTAVSDEITLKTIKINTIYIIIINEYYYFILNDYIYKINL